VKRWECKKALTQEERLKEIITLMEEKGYDPKTQLKGYIELDNDTYITRHGGAREKIKEIDKGIITAYIDGE